MYEMSHNDKGGFYMMPRQLFTENCPLSLEAKVMYMMILDRMNLSLKNNFRDKNGKLFVYFTVFEAAKLLGCSDKKAGKLIVELEKAEYIGRKKQGLGKPCLIYLNPLMMPSLTRPLEYSFRTYEDVLSRPDDFSCQDMTYILSNYTNII